MHVWYACILNQITNKCICKGPFEHIIDADTSIRDIKDISNQTMLLSVCKFQPSWLIKYKLRRNIVNSLTNFRLDISKQ